MATQADTKTTKSDDVFDVRHAVERWTEASRKAGNGYLDIYQEGVERYTDVTRRVADTYVKAARRLINA
jgi:hypothetical protein